ncbi:MAG: hypothetical protein A2176_02020 [Spirochaetes bacterium RBG_13_51_14]|nr:MAG: hypothetical protein A2176_02020 [Spirochaetes bacterium RBG_13_51_14]
MKKRVTIGRAMLGLIILYTLLTAAIAHGNAPDYEWGAQLGNVKKTLPSDKELVQFTPRDDPKYENKIMSYIIAIDNNLIDKILIVRVKSQPVIDYLFVSDKLYTVMENWGEVDQKTEKNIQSRLASQFGEPLVQKDNNFYIYSFKSDKTKVLCYVMKLSDGKSKCKVYYYTKQLFKMLITG